MTEATTTETFEPAAQGKKTPRKDVATSQPSTQPETDEVQEDKTDNSTKKGFKLGWSGVSGFHPAPRYD